MPPVSKHFPLAKFAEIQGRPDDFRLLERIPSTKQDQKWPLYLLPTVGDEIPMVILDTETTGLDPLSDSIIELGLVRVAYSPSIQRITLIDKAISLYEDPKRPIPEFIVALTGISDDLVRGERFDEHQIAQWFADDPLIIAHNAAFDRQFFEMRFKGFENLAWACSATEIPWSELGYQSRKLEYLLLSEGWFYEGHRASIDCLAVAWLLHVVPNALESLLSQSSKATVIVRAFGAPFAVKDLLKERGYRWCDGTTANKHWWTEIPKNALEEETVYLGGLYKNAIEHAHVEELSARDRFKEAFFL